jgi:hypothetical protein
VAAVEVAVGGEVKASIDALAGRLDETRGSVAALQAAADARPADPVDSAVGEGGGEGGRGGSQGEEGGVDGAAELHGLRAELGELRAVAGGAAALGEEVRARCGWVYISSSSPNYMLILLLLRRGSI